MEWKIQCCLIGKKKKNCKPLQFLKNMKSRQRWCWYEAWLLLLPKTFMLNIQLYLCTTFDISTMHIFFFLPQMNLLFAFEMGGKGGVAWRESAPSWSRWSLAGRCQLPRSVSKLGRHRPSIMEHAATLPAQQRSTSGMSRAVVTLRLGQIASTWYISSRAIQPVSLVRGTWHEDGWIIHTHNRPLCPAAKPGPTVILVHNW